MDKPFIDDYLWKKELKILVVGMTGVGKSSIIKTLTNYDIKINDFYSTTKDI
jgi:GTP1/Obg family GTP-binding protein